MLTSLTQQALAVLHDIASREAGRLKNYPAGEIDLPPLLHKLEKAGLIFLDPDLPADDFLSYRLCRPLNCISLLDVIEATGEHLNCNRPTSEEFYFRYGAVAQKLGVVNQMTRSFLADIKLTDC